MSESQAMEKNARREERKLVVDGTAPGADLLAFLSARLIYESKRRLRHLISQGAIRLNGRAASPLSEVREGDQVVIPADLNISPPSAAVGAALRVEVLYEDGEHIVINKPAGYPVLPARDGGQRLLYDSLVWMLNRDIPAGGPYLRPHLVHRLDRQTSGVLIVAKNMESSRSLGRQFERGGVQKRYVAIVEGRLPRDEIRVEIPLSEAPSSVLRMRPDQKAGKRALSLVKLKERFRHFSLVEVLPLTGRQHQIRVHLAAIGYPLAVDFLYGRRDRLTESDLKAIVGARRIRAAGALLERCPLHAAAIAYRHPVSSEPMRMEAPLPEDMKEFLGLLRRIDA